ncbi:35382_t:CDS:2, partial [Gigaspora margarita]
MSSQNVTSPFPLPPEFYKRYTDENLDKLKRIKEHGIEAFTNAGDTLPQDFDIFDLEPPKPITKGFYRMFDESWPVVDRMCTLEETNLQQLYPKGEIALELKKLNNSVVFNFVELLDILVKDPDRGPDKCEQIKLLLINMKFLLNEYRPHQARETLQLIMKEQIEQRKLATKEIQKRCNELTQTLANLKNSWKNLDVVKMELDDTENSESADIVPE